MFQKKTSRRTRKSRDRMLELRVSSPRIMMFEWLRFGGKVLKLGSMMLVVGAMAFGLKGAWNKLFLYNTGEFGLKKMPLASMDGQATNFLTEKRVEEATGLSIDGQKTIFQFDSAKIERQLRDLPEIAEVDVTRRLPDTFEIQVKERMPVAWIACPLLGLEEKSSENGLLLDIEGVPFRCATKSISEYARDLPVVYAGQLPENAVVPGKKISHEGLSEALKLVVGLNDHLSGYDQPDWVMVKDEITLEAMTRNGIRAIFSYFDQERQLENFVKIISHAQDKGEQLDKVNLIPYRLVPVNYR